MSLKLSTSSHLHISLLRWRSSSYSFANVCNIAPFKRQDCQLIKQARQAFDELAWWALVVRTLS